MVFLGISSYLDASTLPINAEKKFNNKVIYESKKVIKVYDSEIKKVTKQGKLELAQELKVKKEEFISKISEIISAGEKVKVKNSIKGKKFVWSRGNHIFSDKFTLGRSGKIVGYTHPNEVTWGINDDAKLVLYNATGNIKWTFNKMEKIKGKWRLEAAEGHTLTQK